MEKKILIIDDEEMLVDMYKQFLEKFGYAVETAGTGQEGLEMAKGADFSLILLDLNMPGINGIETLRKLRADGSDVPVCIVTGFDAGYYKDLQLLSDDGIEFELLRKPVSGTQLKTFVQNVLG